MNGNWFYSLLFCLLFYLPVFAGTCSMKVLQLHDWYWVAPEKPLLKILLVNNSVVASKEAIRVDIATDRGVSLYCLSQTVTVGPGSSAEVEFAMAVDPGFYRCSFFQDDQPVKEITIGYEPEEVVSLPDAQPDFEWFWENTLQELAQVHPQFQLVEETNKSSKERKVYRVSMNSWRGVKIEGYLTVPAMKNRKYPAIISYMGYANKPWYAKPESRPDFIEFVISVRGQGLLESNNPYGDWIVCGLQNEHDYYYRGAFMDLIRAIDFVWQLPQTDRRYVFAEGGSQGGAFTLIACALDKRIKAAAPWIPFLTDFPDYLKIAKWPANVITKQQRILDLPDKELFKVLSYFDTKNFARKITCPLLMGVGLQDQVCPPHTNFASYNLVRSPKQFVIYPACGHDVEHPDWENRQLEFFRQFIQ